MGIKPYRAADNNEETPASTAQTPEIVRKHRESRARILQHGNQPPPRMMGEPKPRVLHRIRSGTEKHLHQEILPDMGKPILKDTTIKTMPPMSHHDPLSMYLKIQNTFLTEQYVNTQNYNTDLALRTKWLYEKIIEKR
eukprot:UN06319